MRRSVQKRASTWVNALLLVRVVNAKLRYDPASARTTCVLRCARKSRPIFLTRAALGARAYVVALIPQVELLFPDRQLRRRGRILRALAAATAGTQSANSRRYAAQILDQADKALAARQRAIECCHGAGQTRIVIMNPGLQNAAE